MSQEATNPIIFHVQNALPPDLLVVTWGMNHAKFSSMGVSEFFELCSSTSTLNIIAVKDNAFIFHVDTLSATYQIALT